MKAVFGQGNISLLSGEPENGEHKDGGELIWNKKPVADFLPLSLHVNFTRSRMTLVLLPWSIDDELDERKC